MYCPEIGNRVGDSLSVTVGALKQSMGFGLYLFHRISHVFCPRPYLMPVQRITFGCGVVQDASYHSWTDA